MKQFIIAIALMMVCHVLFAQKAQVIRASNYVDSGELDKALECISIAIDPGNEKSERSINWPRSWQVRGEVFQSIFRSNEKKYSSLTDDPLTEAVNAYKKALSLDAKNKYSKNLKVNLTLLINDLQTAAIRAYDDSLYANSVIRFEQVLEINALPLFKADNENFIDTAIVYNCGMACMRANQLDKAIKYFTVAAENNYNPEASFLWMGKVYQYKQDSLTALETLVEGARNFPTDIGLMNQLIQLLVDLDRRDEAIKYIDKAIDTNDNVNYYLVKGDLYKKDGDEENAIKQYERALKQEPENVMALFNLGVVYYNRGVRQVELAAQVPINDQAAYKEEIRKSEVWWEKSLPYMEKCYQLDSNDRTILETLKTLYLRLKMMEKYEEMKEKLS